MDDFENQARLYRLLVENSLGLMCIHDLNGVLISINPAVAESLGYPPEYGHGRNLREFLVPALRHLFDDYLERIEANGEDSGLFRLVAYDRTERVWMYRNTLYKREGSPAWVLGHALDVTQRIAAERALKEAQVALRQVNDELALRVNERTAELQQANERLWSEIEQRNQMEEELLQARKLESLGVLAGGIAHDLKNLLTLVQGNIELIRMQLDPDGPVDELLEQMAGACQRSTLLASQLLIFAKERPEILLAVGRLVHVMGAIERPLALAAELCPASFDPASASETECRQAWLAGEIVDEVGAARSSGLEAGRDLGRRLPHVLARLLERGVLAPVERAALGTTLGRLGDPRFDSAHWFLPGERDTPLGFLRVESGFFVMGSDAKRDRYAEERKQRQHDVELPEFHIARYPVTVAQFATFVQDSGYERADKHALLGTLNHPVVEVTWHDALAYCDWLTLKLRDWMDAPEAIGRWLDDTIRQNWRVMLPSEAKWEKAARGTDGRIYPWGNDYDPNCGNFADTGIGRVSAVGAFPRGASPCGALDMIGNVWEWTRSCYRPYPYRLDDGREDLSVADDVRRVVRGGSFTNNEYNVRAASRYRNNPNACDVNLGFRVVVSSLRS